MSKIHKVQINLTPMDRKEKRFLFEVEEIIVGISAILLIIAAFLAWGSTPSGTVATGLSAEGWLTDGMLTIGIGAVAIVLLIIDLIYKVPAWIPLLLGIIALGIGGIDFWAMSGAVEKYQGHVGMGLYLTVLASAGIILGSIVDIYRDTKR